MVVKKPVIKDSATLDNDDVIDIGRRSVSTLTRGETLGIGKSPLRRNFATSDR